LQNEDIAQSITATVPLSRTLEEEISRLRRWCGGRARPASGNLAVAGGDAASGRIANCELSN
ncbi:MAG: hypothetical protein ACYC4Q_08410, partial [Victivallaceae bacterium]